MKNNKNVNSKNICVRSKTITNDEDSLKIIYTLKVSIMSLRRFNKFTKLAEKQNVERPSKSVPIQLFTWQ